MENDQQPKEATTNALAIYERMSDPMTSIKEMGQMFASSGMFGCTKLEQGQVLALACLIEGKSPFELMRNYHIIGGNLTMKSVAVLAEFQKRGGTVTWQSALGDGKEAKATFEIGGQSLRDAAYGIDDAKQEGLVTGPNKHNWSARPADMLRARLITKAVRMLAPAVIMGIADDTDPLPIALPLEPLLQRPKEPVVGAAGAAVVEEPDLMTRIKNKGMNRDHVEAFLVNRNLISRDEKMENLTPANQARILKNFDEFVAKVMDFSVEGVK